ncbi:hypothetical protein HBA55_21085 [Pseudomaricurvus alkylphenolicus]|uniref:hypothetical protein n=1 Tax=Pseudomaricurvus alkylphenolicus TaxID=1306991 RepID=UPI00141F5D02|nr:hypothetical protein [Pseudomaricurvus alkylphenolicus]NIB42114.1 hypothetical protein [Pseudomaricurvus alkylphenolicus]
MTNTATDTSNTNSNQQPQIDTDGLVLALPPSNREVAKRTGSRFYKNGNQCINGHTSHRYTSTKQCAVCVKEYQDRYDQDPEKRRRRLVQAVESHARSRAVELGQVPNDFDSEEVRRYYATAAALAEQTGVSHHVDHNVPLCRGGLHHHDNLSVMPAEANVLKGRKTLFECQQAAFSAIMLDALKMPKYFNDRFGCSLEEYIDQPLLSDEYYFDIDGGPDVETLTDSCSDGEVDISMYREGDQVCVVEYDLQPPTNISIVDPAEAGERVC